MLHDYPKYKVKGLPELILFFCLVTNDRTWTKEKTKRLDNKLPMLPLEVLKQGLISSQGGICIGIECYLNFLIVIPLVDKIQQNYLTNNRTCDMTIAPAAPVLFISTYSFAPAHSVYLKWIYVYYWMVITLLHLRTFVKESQKYQIFLIFDH